MSKGIFCMKKKVLASFFSFFIIFSVFPQSIKNAINDYFSYEVHEKNEYWNYCCSSFLKENNKDIYFYGYNNLFDNDISTAWVEGVDGSGINEYLLIPFYKQDESMFSYKKKKNINIQLQINNGYCKNESLFYKNNRVKKIKITIYDIPLNSDLNNMFVDGEPTVIFEDIIELQDSIEKQEFNFQTKLVNYDSYCIPFTLLKMEILEVYKGTDFDDTAISEIEVFGEYITNN